MRRYSLLVTAFALALTLCASASFAIFPGSTYGTSTSVGDGYMTFKMQQGWLCGEPAWYICTASSSIDWCRSYNVTLAPKLCSAYCGAGAAAMYVVTNPPATQGPIFEAGPGERCYSPIWQVFNVTWKPGVCKQPITSVQEVMGLRGCGKVVVCDARVRMDCPIVAVGELDGPWQSATCSYRIPQGRVCSGYQYTKQIQLPFWYVYCQDPVTRAISVKRAIIPDAYPYNLACLIGANVAPGLAGVRNTDRSLFSVINWAQDFDPCLCGIQELKVLANQYPVLSDSPDRCTWANTNKCYSPVMSFVLLNRRYPFLTMSAETLVSNYQFLCIQIRNGNLQSVKYPTPPLPMLPVCVGFPPPGPAYTYTVNAPVLCPT